MVAGALKLTAAGALRLTAGDQSLVVLWLMAVVVDQSLIVLWLMAAEALLLMAGD